jgi:hypothetical protein
VRGTSRGCRDGRGGRSSVVEVRECRAQVTEGKQPIVGPKRRSWRPCSGSTVAAVERPPGSATQGSAMAPHRRPRPLWVCPPLLVAEGGPPVVAVLRCLSKRQKENGRATFKATGRATPSGHRPHRPETLKTVSDGAHGTAVLVAFPPESDTCRACQQMVKPDRGPWNRRGL